MRSDSKRILLVEDDIFLSQALSECLQDEGYDVACAADGHEALDWLSATSAMPQVIITDLLMPRMNGWDFFDQLRATQQWKGIPVFVLSTAAHTHAWPAGAAPTQQLRKPPDLHHLLQLLANLPSTLSAVVS